MILHSNRSYIDKKRQTLAIYSMLMMDMYMTSPRTKMSSTRGLGSLMPGIEVSTRSLTI